MNLSYELLKWPTNSKPIAIEVAKYAAKEEGNFKSLLECIGSKDKKLAGRAAWSLSFVHDFYPPCILPHLPEMIALLCQKGVYDAVARNILSAITKVELPTEYHGEIMNYCFDKITNIESTAAIKSYSLEIIGKLALLYPEIQPEIIMILNDRMPFEVASFKARGRKILKKLSPAKKRTR